MDMPSLKQISLLSVYYFWLNMALVSITSVSDSGRYYALEEKVGSGAQGEVFRGHDINRPKLRVAVKYAKPLQDNSALNRANSRIMREAGFLMNIKDPRVVRYKDVCTQNKPFIVLEYIPLTLANVPVTQQVIMDYIEQIPGLLSLLQEQNIAHCDLKRDNLGYVQRIVKLLDFGLAIPFEHAVMYPKKAKKIHQAPEFRDYDWVTRTSDTYSAGRVLEHLVTGTNVRTVKEFRQNLAKVSTDLPESFVQLCKSLMQNEYLHRPTVKKMPFLVSDALRDLSKKEYFSFRASVPLADAPLHFWGSASSSSSE